MSKKIFIAFSFMVPLCGTMFFTAYAQNKQARNKVIIQVEHYVGDSILKLDSATYANSLGQPFTVSMFKYYISSIHLKSVDGSEYVCDKYFLVNEEDVASKSITLNDVPDNTYTSLSFTLGVDSARNCSGIQRGALDPLNGMFWAWNTGYVFLKMEGHSQASTSSDNVIEYHIGGYREPNNSIRTIKLSFGENLFRMRTAERPSAIIKLKVDAAEILKTPTTIDFTKLSFVTDFHNAATIADNYTDMFSILKVE